MPATAHLNPDFFSDTVERTSTRAGFGEGLLELGTRDLRVVALSADLASSTHVAKFAKAFPDRFIEVGVAEQALITVASGLAAAGKIPFAASYAIFSPGRTWEHLRTTACVNELPVKVVGSHGGLTVGPDGATHQALEDLALARVLPGMEVVVPCDAAEAKKATLALADRPAPAYLRLARPETPHITVPDAPFAVGSALALWEGGDAAIFACGPILAEALHASRALEAEGIGCLVINCPSVKPLDADTVRRAAERCGCAVTVEDHQVTGGFGSAVAELLAEAGPRVPMRFIGVRDRFGQSGTPQELLHAYSMDSGSIAEAVRQVIAEKRRN